MQTNCLLLRVRRVQWARWLVAATLAVALAAGVLPLMARALARHAADAEVYDSVYYTALLTGHDPHAAVVKAHYLTGTLMREFRMTRTQAAAYVARSMVWRSNGLCGD